MAGVGRLEGRRLYGVLTEALGNGRPAEELAREALEAGLPILQMREKGLDRPGLLRLGGVLRDLCRAHGALFIVNDDPRLALELEADGVHLGQEDLAAWSFPELRALMGGRLIGLSTHSPEQAREGQALDVDYLAYGPLMPTRTKPGHVGLDHLARVAALVTRPLFGIGGIDLGNLDTVLALGCTRVALIGDLFRAGDPGARVRAYLGRLS